MTHLNNVSMSQSIIEFEKLLSILACEVKMNNPKGEGLLSPRKAPRKQTFHLCTALFIELIFVLIPRIISMITDVFIIIYFDETFSEVKLVE